ncbi:MAG: oligosaccharide flippase family protein [Flavobacteriaceae bacterium]|jgi:O-antigen/teichoic acid export membrane protein|nr:oligosaccharide flippase family protein [Flavobacteriaceae bacterium]
MKDLILKYRVFIKYIGIGYVGVILNVILSIVLMNFFDSKSFGKITLGKSIFQSYEFSHFGTRFGLDRVLPHTESLRRKSFIFSASFYFCLLTSLILSLFWIVYDVENIYFYSFFFLGGFLSGLTTLYRVFYRSEEDKTVFISISIWLLIFPIATQIIAVYFFGMKGLLYSNFITYLIGFIVCFVKYKINLVISYSIFKKYLGKIFSIGFFLFLSSIISFLSLIGDRFIIAKYWGFSSLGDYGVVMFFFTAFTTLSVSYTELIMNKIILNPGFNYLSKQLLIIFGLSLLFVLVSFPILPYFIDYFVPKYSHLISLMKEILIGGIIYSVLPILNYYLHAKDKRRELLIVNVVSSLIYFVGLYIVLINFNSLQYLIYLKIFSFFILVGMTFGLFIFFEKIKKI